jgi:hypothetical protein
MSNPSTSCLKFKLRAGMAGGRWAMMMLVLAFPALLAGAPPPATADEKGIDRVVPKRKKVVTKKSTTRPRLRIRSLIAREIVRKAKARARMGDTCKRVSSPYASGPKIAKALGRRVRINHAYLTKFIGSCYVVIFVARSRRGANKHESYCLRFVQYGCNDLSLKCSPDKLMVLCKHRKGNGWSGK